MKIGAAVAGYRFLRKLSLRELASEMGIGATTLRSLERGRVVNSKTMSKVIVWLHSPETKGGNDVV